MFVEIGMNFEPRKMLKSFIEKPKKQKSRNVSSDKSKLSNAFSSAFLL